MNERQDSVTDTDESFELNLTLADREGFIDLFYEPVNFVINPRTKFNLSVLKIENGDFILDRLYDALAGASLAYVLSRVEYEAAKKLPLDKIVPLVEDVKARFQDANETNGEGERFSFTLCSKGIQALRRYCQKWSSRLAVRCLYLVPTACTFLKKVTENSV